MTLLRFALPLVSASLLFACSDDEESAPTEHPFADFEGVFDVTSYTVNKNACEDGEGRLEDLEERTMMIAYTVNSELGLFLRLSDCSSVDNCSDVLTSGQMNEVYGDEMWLSLYELTPDEQARGEVAHGGVKAGDVCTGRAFDELLLTPVSDEEYRLEIRRTFLNDAMPNTSGLCPADFEVLRDEAEAKLASGAGGAGGSGGSGSTGQCDQLEVYELTHI